jgi:hypothetical protein
MPTIVTKDLAVKYLTGRAEYVAHKDSVKEYTDLKIHMDGEYPEKLIEARRPNEPQHIKDYRKTIFSHISMPIMNKVVAALGKIRKSADFDVKFDTSKNAKVIKKGEELNLYLTKNFPVFKSVDKWAFDVMLKQYLTDANGVIAVFPKEFSKEDTDYHKAFPFIFNSTDVINFVEEDWCLLKTADQVTVPLEDGRVINRDKYLLLTTYSYEVWAQNQSNDGWGLVGQPYIHNMGELPAWKMGGLSKATKQGSFIWRSRIYPMVPRLNEALREYSDLQSGVVQHLHLESWEIESQKCTVCQGIGKVPKEGGGLVKCPNKACNSGTLIPSPYETTIYKIPRAGEQPLPNPPKGVINLNPEIITIQDLRIDKHEFKALSAINMEFLAQTPLATSGESKKMDREETTSFVHGIAEDVIGNMDKVCYYINMWRNRKVITSIDELLAQLPTIPVPEKYDLFTSSVLLEEINAARTAKLSPVVMAALESEYSSKKFIHDEQAKNECMLIIKLDPLPGLSIDEKGSQLFNKGITETDFVISCNIKAFVSRAVTENQSFPMLDITKQREILTKFALEKTKEIMNSQKAKMQMAAEFNNPPE